jgi:hypothetical protein
MEIDILLPSTCVLNYVVKYIISTVILVEK